VPAAAASAGSEGAVADGVEETPQKVQPTSPKKKVSFLLPEEELVQTEAADKAATLIQSVERGKQARHKVQARKQDEKMEASALRIQSVQRGRTVRHEGLQTEKTSSAMCKDVATTQGRRPAAAFGLDESLTSFSVLDSSASATAKAKQAASAEQARQAAQLDKKREARRAKAQAGWRKAKTVLRKKQGLLGVLKMARDQGIFGELGQRDVLEQTQVLQDRLSAEREKQLAKASQRRASRRQSHAVKPAVPILPASMSKDEAIRILQGSASQGLQGEQSSSAMSKDVTATQTQGL
jgi:hypothetical protein